MNPFVYLNSNDDTGIVAFGQRAYFEWKTQSTWSDVDNFINEYKGHYIFSALSYDLKNDIENLFSNHPLFVEFPKAIFFVPEYVIEVNGSNYQFVAGVENDASKAILQEFLRKIEAPTEKNSIQLVPTLTKEMYIEKVNALLHHIQQGDIYEVTFCQNYVGNGEISSPESLYGALNKRTAAPFSVFLKWNHSYLMSASPERFIQRSNDRIITQPIKGTIRRGDSKQEDQQLLEYLKNDPKELAENVMIVDLVRNDLSKIAKKDSVVVDELFGVYTFRTVHQLISTVGAEVKNNTSFATILKALFPMGSMTGAPKISAMKLIEKYEDFQRGLFSGSVGYIMPSGDFNFNVVIRSILYDTFQKQITCPVGSAITILSDPEQEYNECLLKVDAMLSVLNG